MALVIDADVNARRRDYAHLGSEEVLVTKIWTTIQGEGPLAGHPAVFVRLAGCNLGAKQSCPWCDTTFTLSRGGVMSVEDVILAAESVTAPRQRLVVLTGGEPFLQNPHRLVDRFLAAGWTVQVETNGYFWSSELHQLRLKYGEQFMVVISPKVNLRGKYPALQSRLRQSMHSLKILVDADESSPYHHPPPYADEVARDKVIYVSPINIYRARPLTHAVIWDHASALDHERCAANHDYARRLAMERGWCVSVQSHLLLGAE